MKRDFILEFKLPPNNFIKKKKSIKFEWNLQNWKAVFQISDKQLKGLKFSIKNYKIFFLFFRYLILKDLIKINYEMILYHYKLNIYNVNYLVNFNFYHQKVNLNLIKIGLYNLRFYALFFFYSLN